MHIYQANGVLPKGLAQFSRARILDSYCGTAYLARGSFLPQPAEGLARMEMGQVPEDLPCAPAAHDYEDQSAAGTNARSKETRQWAKVGENVEAAEVGEHSIETPNSQFPMSKFLKSSGAKSTGRPAHFWRATASMASDWSVARMRTPREARRCASSPVPQASSKTREPGGKAGSRRSQMI